MLKQIVASAVLLTWLTFVLGLVYPFGMTAIGGLLFPREVQGSLVEESGTVKASILVGRNYTEPGDFWGRPSATGPEPYNASASGGSNLAVQGKVFQDLVRERLDYLKDTNPAAHDLVPVDLVTASGSGLDPHISLKAALWQLPRVAEARGLSPESLQTIVMDMAEGGAKDWYMSPERVNVVILNTYLATITP